MKGIVFSGCSFTWGEGLNYYSDLLKIKFNKYQSFDINDLSNAELKFIEANRYARLVTEYFDSYEIIRNTNGGSNYQILDFVKKNLGIFEYQQLKELPNYKLKEISAVILQITDVMRIPYQIHSERLNKNIFVNQIDFENNKRDIIRKEQLKNLMFEYGNKFEEKLIEKLCKDIEDLFKYLKSNGIVCKLLFWQNSNLDLFFKNKFIFEHTIPILLNNTQLYSIDLVYNFNEIYSNAGYFKQHNVLINDSHPSLLCHQLIAESIIQNLQNDRVFIDRHYNRKNNFL